MYYYIVQRSKQIWCKYAEFGVQIVNFMQFAILPDDAPLWCVIGAGVIIGAYYLLSHKSVKPAKSPEPVEPIEPIEPIELAEAPELVEPMGVFDHIDVEFFSTDMGQRVFYDLPTDPCYTTFVLLGAVSPLLLYH